MFCQPQWNPLRGNTLYQAFVRARKRVGLDDVTFHDLRHTGQPLAAQTGAPLADLMKRLGHSSMAARRYLDAVDGRDREIAKALAELAALVRRRRGALCLTFPGASPGWLLRGC
ncbi:tyrosine-type recombinase/integrase [Micromonospora sp. LZ34]